MRQCVCRGFEGGGGGGSVKVARGYDHRFGALSH